MADAPAPTPDNEQQPDTVEQTIAQASPSDAPLLSEPNESPAATDTSVAEPTAAATVEATEAAETPEPAAETAAEPIQATETAEPVVLSADTPLSDAALSETPLSGVNKAASVSNTAEAPFAAATVDTPTIDSPTVASTLEVPANPMATEAAADQEGGEWELLLAKVRHWISSGQLQEQWQTVRTPLSLLAGLIALLLVLRVYSALLGVLDSIPVLPGLLELAGLIAVAQFSLTRLLRSDDRRDVINGLRQRWQSFRGRS